MFQLHVNLATMEVLSRTLVNKLYLIHAVIKV